MPFFFLLGGAIYKKKLVEDTLKSRFQSIIIPWIIYGVLNGIFTLVIHCLRSIELINDNYRDMFLQICKFQGGWFLVSYFLTCVIFCVLENQFKEGKVMLGVTILLVAILALAISAIDKNGMTNYIITAFIGLLFYYIGVLIKPFVSRLARAYSILVGLILLMLCIFSGMQISNDIRMYSNSYENVLLFLMNSIFGSTGVLLIGKGIHTFVLLEKMGKLSLPIMVIHFPVYQALAYTIQKHEELQAFAVWPMCLLYYIMTMGVSTVLANIVNKYFPAFVGKYKIP